MLMSPLLQLRRFRETLNRFGSPNIGAKHIALKILRDVRRNACHPLNIFNAAGSLDKNDRDVKSDVFMAWAIIEDRVFHRDD
jgi:dihydroorotate dehydrogenase